MTTTLMLRIASAISFLFAAGHCAAALQKWSPIGENDVLTRMANVHFKALGVSRSYLELFLGMGWSLAIAMLLQTVLLWQMAVLARTNMEAVRSMIVAFALAALASGVIAWRLILPIPALFSAALFLSLVAAYITSRRAKLLG